MGIVPILVCVTLQHVDERGGGSAGGIVHVLNAFIRYALNGYIRRDDGADEDMIDVQPYA